MSLISIGKLNFEAAKYIYNNKRQIVDALVKSGKILAKNADKEWARRVAAELTKKGYSVSKKILSMMK